MSVRLERASPGELVAPAATPTASARILVARLASRWGVALPALEARGEVPVAGNTIVRLQQIVDGLPVEAGELHVLVRPSGELVAASGVPVDLATPRTPARFVDDEAAAIARAVDRAPVARARARQVWHRDGERLIAAWLVEAFLANGDAERVVLAGDDGRVLARRSLVDADGVGYRVYADSAPEVHPHDGPLVDFSPHPTGTPDKTYPALSTSSLVTVVGLNHPAGGGGPDPWLPANPTATTGNNIEAYSDDHTPDGFSAGDIRATPTSANQFDRQYDFSLGPLANANQQMASITALFFTLNWMHDFWYDAGFIESAMNAQTSNLGRGGMEGDVLLAEAQDGALTGSRNNANMATPDDGMSPRMQVFLWSGHQDHALVTTPGATLQNGTAGFGPQDYTATGTVAAALDGVGTTTDACTALTNAATLAGKIVLVDRGQCSYKTKVLAAQGAGAAGVIVANNVAGGTSPNMGDDTTVTAVVTIPAMAISLEDGATLRASLANGSVSATMSLHSGPEIDGAFDASVIAHEHGHYLHHRLSQCNTPICGGMSEGWADFSGLMLEVRDGDDLAGAFPIGQYATTSFAGDPGYFGIRRVPYSTTRAIDPLTFIDMANGQALPMVGPIQPGGANAEVHNTGEVWATVLWEAYIAILKEGPDFTTARAKMARYVVAGLLLAPPDATPTETRDALLVAIGAEDPHDADIVAFAFARRGFGSCAVSPPRTSTDNLGIVESTILSGHAVLGATSLGADGCDLDGVLDVGETATITVPIANDGYHPLADVTVTLTSPTPDIVIATPVVTIGAMAATSQTSATFAVSYTGARGISAVGELDVTLTSTGGCVNTLSRALPIRLETDDVPASSTDDSFDTADSAWTASDATVWTHARTTALDGTWVGANVGRRSDSNLTSPSLDVASDADLTIAFSHRFAFEFTNNTAFDGGLIEVSPDGGATWTDLAALMDPGYNGTITDQADNPLKTRRAFVHQNPSYPGFDHVSVALGRKLAGQTIKLRFRIGSDANTGAEGWTVDDVAIQGITNHPFPTAVGDNDVCGVGPGIDGGTDGSGVTPGNPDGGCCSAAPVSAGNLLLGLGIFGFVGRRRRRA